jgi:hypothetical protein
VGRLYPQNMGRQTKPLPANRWINEPMEFGARLRLKSSRFFESQIKKPGPEIFFLQLFSSRVCPAIEIQSIDMKSNIISFTPQEARQEIRSQGSWIRIESESAFGLIEWLLVLWLGGWSLFAGIEFLRSTGILVF